MAKTARERLREYCTRHGYKQYELAQLLGIAEAHLSQILSGVRRPGLPIAVRIEDVTGIPAKSWMLSAVSTQGGRKRLPTPMAEIS